MKNIDLRLLVLFDEIYKCANLSTAAQKVGLSQPGVSLALGRLRRHFGDPLFVRTPRGMEATLFAQSIFPSVQNSIAALQSVMSFRMDFFPTESDRTFRVSMSDVGQIVLLPLLMDRMSHTAPHARIEVAQTNGEIHDELAGGIVDLAVGVSVPVREHLFQQVLFRSPFVCMARLDHPRVGDGMTLNQYLSEGHVLVTRLGAKSRVVDKALEELGLQRRVRALLPNFVGLSGIIASTDYICTLPRIVAEVMANRPRVKLVDLPFELPAMTVKQHWHARQDQDPGHQWLRSMIASLELRY